MICNALTYITLTTFTIAFSLDLIATIRQAWQSAALTSVTPATSLVTPAVGDPWLVAMSEAPLGAIASTATPATIASKQPQTSDESP